MSSNWIESTVGEYLPFIYGKGLPKRERKSGNIPVYGSNGVVGYHSVAHVNKAGIIIGRKGSIGEIHLSKVPFWPIDTSFYVVKDSFNELLFAFYLLKNLGLDEKNTDSAIPGLNREYAHSLKIKIPETEEQRIKLGRWLYSFDKKIELNNQINDTLEAMAQAIFKSWFVDFDPVHAKAKAKADGLDAEGINRVAMAVIASKSDAELTKMKADSPAEYEQLKTLASLFPDQLEESELGLIPQGWEVSTIGEEYDVVMGQSPKGETYNESGEGTLFYQGRAEFDWRFPTPRLYTTDPKRMAKEGDILMSVRAPVGDFNIALEDCCIGRGLSALRHKSGSSTFSFYQLLSLKPELDRYNGEGTVFGSINQTNLKKINCISPANDLVNHFVEKVSVLDKKIQSNTLENIALTELRDALLPKLLSGEIEV